MTMNLLRNLLAEFGYGLSFRGDVWTECLAARGSELWVGRGHDEDDALTEIVRQMFPSALSRLLLAREQEPAQASRFGTSNGNGVAASSVRLAASSPSDGTTAVNDAPRGLSAADNTSTPVSTASSSSVAAAVYNMGELAPGGSSTEGTAGTRATDLTAASLSQALPAPVPSTCIRAAALTDRGRRRLRNEDACLVVAERGLVAVADGLGAHARGDVASTMAIEVLRKAFQDDVALSPARSKGLPMLLAAIERANAEIFDAGQRDPLLHGMGTTVAAVLVVGRQVVLAHVGDSRIYRLRRGVLELCTTDHSLINHRIRSGEPIGAACKRVTRAVGTRPRVEVETSVVTSQPGDVLLLCTDGLHGLVPHEEMSELLEQHTAPEITVQALVARANTLGGIDNITAAVIRLER